MLVVDHLVRTAAFPAAGALQEVSGSGLFTGGVACTFARDLRRMGYPVRLAGVVGEDPLGAWLLDVLEADVIDISGVCRRSGMTPSSVVLVDDEGERRFLFDPGVLEMLHPRDLPALSGVRHVHVGGAPRLGGWMGGSLAAYLEACRDAGITTSLDTVGADEGWPGVRALLPHFDLACPSYEEARAITGLTVPRRQVDVLIAEGAEAAAVKLGACGALWGTKDGLRFAVRPPEGVHPVDATGAGEAFCAAAVHGLLSGASIEDVALGAVSAGTLATQRLGGPLTGGLDELEAWSARHPCRLVFMKGGRTVHGPFAH